MALTADWNPLGDVFYRKFELYCMQWTHVDLSKLEVAAAPYGGPIALIRDEVKAQKMGQTGKPSIFIFNSAGQEVAVLRWSSGRVIKLGWSNSEELLCVQDDGSVLIYDMFATYKRTFSMGQEAKDVKVLQCQIFPTSKGCTGIAVLTTSYRIFLVSNIEDPRIRRLAEIPGLDVPPSCWCVISLASQSLHVLVARDNQLYSLDQMGQCTEVTADSGSSSSEVGGTYIEMALSFNHKNLALFSSSGVLWLGTSDLSTCYCQFDTKCQSRPKQLVWCGETAVAGYWEDILLMVGPLKDWIKFTYDTTIHCVSEVDGLRIIGYYSHEFLHQVPGVVQEIFKIGSMSPGAMLYEACKEFNRGSQRADEYIRMIKDQLGEAVYQCIHAAAHEYEPANQKKLLSAASFGKCFLSDYNSEDFVRVSQELRVLNAVRAHNVGIPLTYAQLKQLTKDVLIDRLILRRHYALAVKICQYLRLPDNKGASRVVAHWACYKVQQQQQDQQKLSKLGGAAGVAAGLIAEESLAKRISEKIGDYPGVSYSEIANKAFECGKTDLAIQLLNYEPRASEQIPLLMKMKNDALALSKAIESGDTDLVYMVLMKLKDRMPQGEFLIFVRSQPIAQALYLQYCRQDNKKILQDLYYQADNHFEEANCRVAAFYDEERLDARMTILLGAQEAYTKAKNEVAAKVSEEQLKLMRYQRRLEEELNRPFLDLSLDETMRRLAADNNHKLVEQMHKEFKVPDRRFWWLKISVLAEKADWIELDRFSKSKKSPIGYEPFLEVCIKNGNTAEAKKYLTRVTPENLVKCHIKLGQLEQAADIAIQTRNIDDLNLVLNKCGAANRSLADRVIAFKSQLHGGK